ncbi:4-hydroxy-tetrahydrodipicolinate reductase [Allobranchiibius sp. GilTou73]|uniref:4-hydroxy-tetrahydrodipicolinate reductase n=1 Tax=Allobranchiibius sp. GilTou73 TaxID=2904523 RepID=UPI002105FC4C|nr:4-hydroxy-tetrahydrodipicolinate reductase [Allobranchiibius sp. GilTou73]
MSERIPVAVIGSSGRMGSAAVQAIDDATDLDLVGRFDHGDPLGDLGGASVAVELTTPDASPDNVAHCVAAGVHCVVGTTGWSPQRLQALEAQLVDHPRVGVLIAPNFAIGALLMMAFAQRAARFYESVEIIETHHPDKVDAPSGTAARTASLVAAARASAGLADVPDATRADPDGARGARIDGIPVHALRMRGRVAHQEVAFGAAGEALTIRHDSFDRVSFMPGVLAAARAIGDRPGLTVGLEHLLDL